MTPRDFSRLFTNGRCVICNQPRTVAGYDVHSEVHLARGEAIVDDHRVIPTPTEDETRPVYSGKRTLDPILRRLVRAEQRKQNRSPR